MLVSYHKFRLENELFIDGANLYSVENSKLIEELKGTYCFTTLSHDIKSVASGKEDFSKLKSDDVVISNAGPYAFLYHYIREKKGLDFRIIRDVQTAFWQGYFLQEKLCGSYTREGDSILFLSEFQRQLFIKLFPESLNEENTFVCAPFVHFFPKKLPTEEKDYDGLTLGWIGRVTHEKGFHVALEAFIMAKKQLENVRMIIAGGRSPAKFKNWVSLKLTKNKIGPDAFIHLNQGKPIPSSSIWNVYKKCDVFLFPSVSPNEALGRVMVEAAYCKIPVIAAYHAATPEVLEKKNLLPVNYNGGLLQLAGLPNLGYVDHNMFTNKILNHKKLLKTSKINKYLHHDKKYANIIIGGQKKERVGVLNKKIKDFIEGIKMYQNRTLSPNKSFDKLRMFLTKENYAVLSLFDKYIPAYMGYNPYILFFADEERPFSKKMCIKTQKFIMHAKHPIKIPFKKYYFFKCKQFLKNRGY